MVDLPLNLFAATFSADVLSTAQKPDVTAGKMYINRKHIDCRDGAIDKSV
jgi:hypothetical protein